ncbi:hypothetical protein C435_20063 [Haloarcula marismortui ATCC 33799]|uniref:Uncharacterized protein n=1 Tax=Haloarcula marismortui ATCC 33799 TaxID=662475 RepID=M0JN26_9EURY|nr:hypothetical protein [Haloarcula californiae]EMA10421.1 hypothetical protein C435_20063 [Haloarcula californiae ATCC 33799]
MDGSSDRAEMVRPGLPERPVHAYVVYVGQRVLDCLSLFAHRRGEDTQRDTALEVVVQFTEDVDDAARGGPVRQRGAPR